MKVWVVTTGSYSDMAVDSIFTDETAARIHAARQYDGWIEEFETTDTVSSVPRGQSFTWEVWLYKNTSPTVSWDGKGLSDKVVPSFEPRARYHYSGYVGTWTVSAKTEAQALKIATDMDAKRRAEEEGL